MTSFADFQCCIYADIVSGCVRKSKIVLTYYLDGFLCTFKRSEYYGFSVSFISIIELNFCEAAQH